MQIYQLDIGIIIRLQLKPLRHGFIKVKRWEYNANEKLRKGVCTRTIFCIVNSLTFLKIMYHGSCVALLKLGLFVLLDLLTCFHHLYLHVHALCALKCRNKILTCGFFLKHLMKLVFFTNLNLLFHRISATYVTEKHTTISTRVNTAGIITSFLWFNKKKYVFKLRYCRNIFFYKQVTFIM